MLNITIYSYSHSASAYYLNENTGYASQTTKKWNLFDKFTLYKLCDLNTI